MKKLASTLFKNKNALIGSSIVLFFLLMAVISPLLPLKDPLEIHQSFLKMTPLENSSFLLGTDDLGRDLLSRIIYGSRISLETGLSVVFLSLIIGTFLGLISGYFGGFIDSLVMQMVDFIMTLPVILFAIVIVSILGPGIKNAIIAVSIVAIPNFTRVIRSRVIEEKNKEYVDAARSFGSSDFKILFKEILPNCMAPLIVQASLGVSEGILNTAALGFLGLGAKPPTPEWGTMLSDARHYIESSPHLVIFPGICILLVVLGFNLLGDGLRDILDPKIK